MNEVISDLGSDQMGFKIEFDLEHILTGDRTVKYNYKKCNLEKINTDLIKYINQQAQSIITTNQITDFSNKVSEIITQNTPLIKNQNFSYPLPPFIVRLIKEKRRMLREYYARPDPEIKTLPNLEINEEQDKNFYTKIRKLTRYKVSLVVPDLEENDITYSTDQEKVKKFHDYYEQHFNQTDHPDFEKDNKVFINRWYGEFFNEQLEMNQPKEELDPNEYYKIIHSEKDSALESDNIP
ncbi:unnamed protein product [Ceutorhynchus assimilis]|uniref:Uncharacterized protein n=1 Tax=Ceutorhynchus assimilis TaxID=467358 RepID=A0A9N9QPX5_9CUCU|nr:unnamed protein product [Ceutorhynchus assimilis]